MNASLKGLIAILSLVMMVGCASHDPNEAHFDNREEARAFR